MASSERRFLTPLVPGPAGAAPDTDWPGPGRAQAGAGARERRPVSRAAGAPEPVTQGSPATPRSVVTRWIKAR